MTERQRSKLKELKEQKDSQLNNKSAVELAKESELLRVLRVRRMVASNPNTPRQVLMRLADDESGVIRRGVAEHPKTPVDVLRRLGEDVDMEVRLAVAENPNTPLDVLALLAEDADADVRYGVAENPLMPEEILFILSIDENPYIRCRALKTLHVMAPDVQTRLKILLQETYESMIRVKSRRLEAGQ